MTTLFVYAFIGLARANMGFGGSFGSKKGPEVEMWFDAVDSFIST